VRLVDLNRAARLFLGGHDFGAFGSAARKGGGTKRTVSVSRWAAEEGVLRYEIVAEGFLYRMVRRLVFVQVAVCQGKCSQAVLRDALESGRRVPGLPAGTAPAQGLKLAEVKY
jgi:tRNA pseudouridine38-40 synthase